MRLLTTLGLSLLLAYGLPAQDKKASIVTTLNEYFDLLGEQKVSQALDYVHPDLINMMGKEMFESQYNQLFNSPGLSVSIDGYQLDTLSSFFEHEGTEYAMVDYTFRMTFVVDMSNDNDGILHSALMSGYQTQFGKDNVTSEKEGTYLIQPQREMFVVNRGSFDGWKIVDYEPGMKIFLKKIIPETVFAHFKK